MQLRQPPDTYGQRSYPAQCQDPRREHFLSEDISAIRRINLDLRDATERIEEENDLIEEENRITAEKVRYETQNRLYDRIAAHTHYQLVEISEALQETSSLELRMQFSLVLGAYIKRCANLMLIADQQTHIPTEELALAVGESFEYLRFLGVDCALERHGTAAYPAQQILAAYDVFERVMETQLSAINVCSVDLLACPGELVRIETDSPRLPDLDGIALHGLCPELTSEEDLCRIRLLTGGDVHG